MPLDKAVDEPKTHFRHIGQVDINAQNDAGNTPLHQAVMWHSTRILKLILETNGVNKNLENENGLTALELARLYGYDEMSALLLSETQEATDERMLHDRSQQFGESIP